MLEQFHIENKNYLIINTNFSQATLELMKPKLYTLSSEGMISSMKQSQSYFGVQRPNLPVPKEECLSILDSTFEIPYPKRLCDKFSVVLDQNRFMLVDPNNSDTVLSSAELLHQIKSVEYIKPSETLVVF